MLDWLRTPRTPPVVAIGDTQLPIAIRRLGQARRMTLRLAPDGSEARVSIPRWATTAEAVAFARSRADWLARQLDTLPVATPPAPGGALCYRGVELPIVHDPAWPRQPRLRDDAICLGGPTESVTQRLHRWLRREALAVIGDDLATYCQRDGRPAPRLSLSSARRRWGSCAADGTIRINWRLIMAPDAVRRSVVAHEVAHLSHFDHSPAFHAHLAALFEGDIAAANRWLKREGRKLYAAFG